MFTFKVSTPFPDFRAYTIFLLSLAFMVNACSTGSEGGDEKLFQSSSIAPGESFSYTFNEEGSVDYYCTIHPIDMQGTITVSSGTSSSEADTVVMADRSFTPVQLTIAPDTRIVWVNEANETHTVVSGNPETGNGGAY